MGLGGPGRRALIGRPSFSLGWDGFVLSQDVVLRLRDAGLDIAADVKPKSDLAKVQAQFNAWAAETGLPYVHLSRICAMSIGENYAARERAEAGFGPPSPPPRA